MKQIRLLLAGAVVFGSSMFVGAGAAHAFTDRPVPDYDGISVQSFKYRCSGFTSTEYNSDGSVRRVSCFRSDGSKVSCDVVDGQTTNCHGQADPTRSDTAAGDRPDAIRPGKVTATRGVSTSPGRRPKQGQLEQSTVRSRR